MPRPKKLVPGMFVEIHQAFGGGQWLPFLVTHVYEDGKISGVGFSGEPGGLAWNDRGTQSFNAVEHGFGVRQYRFYGEEAPESEETSEPEEPLPFDDEMETDTEESGDNGEC